MLVERVRELAAARGVTADQVALASRESVLPVSASAGDRHPHLSAGGSRPVVIMQNGTGDTPRTGVSPGSFP